MSFVGGRYGTLASELDRIAAEGRVCILELETDGALKVQEEVEHSVTLFIAADVPELERRLRDRETESSGEIGERIALARQQLEQAYRFRYMVATTTWRGPPRRSQALDRARVAACSYHGPSMIHPRIDELLNVEAGGVDSRYALVIVAAKRARQINNYHHQLGEGMGFEEAPPPLVESRSKNYLTMALEEIAAGQDQVRLRQASPARSHRGSRAQWAMARILLGITGGIAAYKACELVPPARQGGSRRACRCPTQARRTIRSRRDVLRARAQVPEHRSLSAPRARRPARDRAAAPQTRSRSWRTGSPTTFSPRRRSRTAGRCWSRRR